jgi:hypothetical protein
MFYQDGGAWKEITRTGGDTYETNTHVGDGTWMTDWHDVQYVYVDQDVTVKRAGRYGASDTNGGTKFGYDQTYYEKLPANAKGAGEAWGVNHPTASLSLKRGWNQIEVLHRYAGDQQGTNEWEAVRKLYRISAGIMGPFGTITEGSDEFLHSDDINPDETGPRRFSQEGNQIQVPWVVN